MAKVLINCPSTGQPVAMGLEMTPEAFATATLINNSVNCPHCKQTHTWNKSDAYLEGGAPLPR